MAKSFKWKSRIGTVVGALGLITATQWADLLPAGYESMAPIIVALLSIFVTLYTEEIRVTRAEEMKEEELRDDEEGI